MRWNPVEAAVAAGDWSGALALLEADVTAADDPRGLELLATAAYGAGHLEQTFDAWERLFTLHRDRGERADAARAAALLAMYLMMDTGLMAPVRGWLGRAADLAGDEDDPAHAWIALGRTYERLLSGDMEATAEAAARAVELGHRHGLAPAVAIGGVGGARARIFLGELEAGLAELDEVALMLTTGEVDPLTTGMVWCELICAMQGMAQYDRAEEWTEAMDHWRPGHAFGGINGRCRVHRAEMLRLRGPYDQAEIEALRACEELRPWMRREFGWPLTELGNVRYRRGDLAGAEEAYLAAHANSWSPQPGLALVRLARGDTAGALDLIRDALDRPDDIPSKERPPFGPLRRAPLLDAMVEIAVAAGDVEAAVAAADELTTTGARFRSRALQAAGSLARGRVALATGDIAGAHQETATAVDLWTELGAPWEAAAARAQLAEVQERSGNPAAAELSRAAAAEAARSLGAALWAQRWTDGDTHPDHGVPKGGAVTEASTDVAEFRCQGGLRRVSFAGTEVTVSDLKGMRYLARLLDSPAREFHVLDLVAVEHGVLPGPATPDHDLHPEQPLDVLDATARDAYRRRLVEVEADIDEARAMHDEGWIARAEADRDYLVHELASAVGLGGRGRTTHSATERARSSVTRTIHYALARLSRHHTTLGEHLSRTVHTGTYCRYDPDPLHPVRWDVT